MLKLLTLTSLLLLTACADLTYVSRDTTETDTVIRVKPDSPCTQVKNQDIELIYNCDK